MARLLRLALGPVAAVVALALAPAAGAVVRLELRLPMDDGVELAATLWLPEGPRTIPPPGTDPPVPVTEAVPGIVMLHGLGGTRASTNAMAEQSFAQQGYAVLTYDARAHGQSGGLFSGAGTREIADLRALHAWLAARPEVRDDAIGVLGISYGGGQAWNALAAGVPFAAAEVVETWTDLYEALVPGNLAKSGAVFGFLSSVPADRMAGEITAIRADALASTNLPALRAFAASRSVRARLGSLRTPTLVFQGRRDFAFGLEQGIAAFRRLAGPKRLYIGPFGHAPSTFPGPDAAELLKEGTDWFDRFLKGVPNGVDTRPPVRLLPDPYRAGAGAELPGLPATRTLAYRTRGRSAVTGTGAFTRELGRTRTLLETFGTPVVRLSASGTFRHVVASLLAVTPDGRRLTVAHGGAAVTLGRRPRTVPVRLSSQATTIPAGSRLRLRVGATSGDALYLIAPPRGARLAVGPASLSLPVLRAPVSR